MVVDWDAWFSDFFGSPTPLQRQAWKSIDSHCSTLICAPTGSGKTMAAFFPLLVRLLKKRVDESANETRRVSILYVSPLRALVNDMEKNLFAPVEKLNEFLGLADGQGIRIASRTGDTTATERQRMVKNPPDLLVTTPESLFLLAQSPKARIMLKDVEAVVIDELHALLASKRSAHFFLTLSRIKMEWGLSAKVVALSATLDEPAAYSKYLKVFSNDEPAIVEAKNKKNANISILLPCSPLQAITSHDMWDDIYGQICKATESEQSVLVFVNTRKLAEKLSFALGELMGREVVGCHHGSLSKDKRLECEHQLKEGKLKLVIATASLELGIDVGAVSLVIQIGSPRNVSTFTQRLGRSGHGPYKTPKCFLFPLTRDELVETMAIFRAYKDGKMDTIVIQDKPMDILAQHLIALSCYQSKSEEELWVWIESTPGFEGCEKQELASLLAMLSEGYVEGRERYAPIIWDKVDGVIQASPSAPLMVLSASGAIPETNEFRVVSIVDQSVVGSLNEEFAVESTAGDVFLLGNTSWRYLYLKGGDVFVESAGDQLPSLPFWQGEAPGRSDMLSLVLDQTRQQIADTINFSVIRDYVDGGELELFQEEYPAFFEQAVQKLLTVFPVSRYGIIQVLLYVQIQRLAFGCLPSRKRVIFERCFDEAMGMQLVIHSCFGARINKAWGLALRKKFCRSFNFELQAAADDNGIVLSLGEQHSFPIEQLFHLLTSKNITEVLVQAVLDSPMFNIRWRWNMNCSLAIPKAHAGKRVPPAIQRYRSDDLLSSAFPMATACLENIIGDIEVPEHPLVRQTLGDCIDFALDSRGLELVFTDYKEQNLEFLSFQTRKPSPFAYELLYSKAYAIIDDGDAEDRRSQKVAIEFSLKASEFVDLAKLDTGLLQDKLSESKRGVYSSTGAFRFLQELVVLRTDYIRKMQWSFYFEELVISKKASTFSVRNGSEVCEFLGLVENVADIKNLYGDLIEECRVDLNTPFSALAGMKKDRLQGEEKTARKIVLGHIGEYGSMTENAMVEKTQLPLNLIKTALLQAEAIGRLVQGDFFKDGEVVWIERKMLKALQVQTKKIRRKSQTCYPQKIYFKSLFELHGLGSTTKSALQALFQLEGFCAPLQEFLDLHLPKRCRSIERKELEDLISKGQVSYWVLPKESTTVAMEPLELPKEHAEKSKRMAQRKLAFFVNDGSEKLHLLGPKYVDQLRDHVEALSVDEKKLIESVTREPLSVKNAARVLKKGEAYVVELISGLLLKGLVYTSDLSFFDKKRKQSEQEQASIKRRSSDGNNFKSLSYPKSEEQQHLVFPTFNYSEAEGLFSTGAKLTKLQSWDGFLEQWAFILLRRYGVVDFATISREILCPSWRVLVNKLRQLEMREEVVAGQIVSFPRAGEQFAHKQFIEMLKLSPPQTGDYSIQSVSTKDPLCARFGLTKNAGIAILLRGELVAILENNTDIGVAINWLKESVDASDRLDVERKFLVGGKDEVFSSKKMFVKSKKPLGLVERLRSSLEH